MSPIHTDVHALIQDLKGNHRAYNYETSTLAYSRDESNSQVYGVRNVAHGHAPFPPFNERAFHYTQAPIPLDASLYNDLEVSHLDENDRELLVESRPLLQRQAKSKLAIAPTRLSPYSNIAPISPTQSIDQHRFLSKQRIVPSPRGFRTQPAQDVHTPPAQRHATSSPNAFLSSPSFTFKQRRTNQRLHARQNTKANVNSRHEIDIDNEQGSSPQLSSLDGSRIQNQIQLSHAPPVIQGIQLISLNEIPDRLRSVFHHPLFNAIQSKCFPAAYRSNDNLVVSAPTGSGKTAILEMAICRLVSGFKTDQFKIVYMAPTKSLCSERQRDWQSKFAVLDLQCAELTGDTDQGQLRSVQSASIVITTPEKWDSMTRKWKDHIKLMHMVKLFLIDEVHILKDTRGATLEAVVSRMKSVGSNVRFIALSATVPNFEDIATWLGKDAINSHIPASRERFGEEFRPVKLQKHVVGLPYKGSDFGFESFCDPRLPDIIAKYSLKKPIIIFCITRKSAVSTAKLLSNLWSSKGPRDRYWEGPTQRIAVQDIELKQTLSSGVAFHHAGLESSDRYVVEKGFLEGQINVICCTSTLAVGINLPCHMVVVKNTVSYQDDGLKEYADLEIMQMLGRAGRPQFDSTAIAVIITKQEKAKKYEKLVSGEEILESCLHLNLIEHLNAEIGLGTIHDLYGAKRWLAGTFLYVRLDQNPDHYKLDGDIADQNLDIRIERICQRDLDLLENAQLTSSSSGKFIATEFGNAMARYYVKFETMRVLMQIPLHAKMSDILSAMVQAEEFHDIRLRLPEKKLFREINKANGIKFPIKVDLAMHAHKRTLLIQAELGGVEFPSDEQYLKHKKQFNQDKAIMFASIHRLTRCVIDCRIHLQDAIAVRHALELARSFGARVWDNTPYEMKQIKQIGLVAIRKLVNGGINNIEDLEASEPHRIEMLLSKQPPFGQKTLADLQDFPKLRVSIKMMAKECKNGQPVAVRLKAECGFMNDKVPLFFNRKPVHVCLLTERSDGLLIDFRRISAKNLYNGQEMLIPAELETHTHYVSCYIMCDEIAGTLRFAELRPELPASLFTQRSTQRRQGHSLHAPSHRKQKETNICRTPRTSPTTLQNDDEYGDDDVGDQDMVDAVEGMDFNHVDSFELEAGPQTINSKTQDSNYTTDQTIWSPEQLENGKWACNHKCKNKNRCKHMCCRDGVDKKPKPPKSSIASADSLVEPTKIRKHSVKSSAQSTGKPLTSWISEKRKTNSIEIIDLAGQRDTDEYAKHAPKDFKTLHRLHESVNKGKPTSNTSRKRRSTSYRTDGLQQLPLFSTNSRANVSAGQAFTDGNNNRLDSFSAPQMLWGQPESADKVNLHETSSDYGSSWHDGLPSPSALLRQNDAVLDADAGSDSLKDHSLNQFNEDLSDTEMVMIGLSDSVMMKGDPQAKARASSPAPSEEEAKTITERTGLESCFSPKPYTNIEANTAETALAQTRHHKLFLSTSSQELPQKRQLACSPDPDGQVPTTPIIKKQKTSDETSGAPHPSSSGEIFEATKILDIKPGQPKWVHDFDPAFIAEWQDIVDFV